MLCACTHDSAAHDLRVGAFPCMVPSCECKGLRLAAEDIQCTGLAAIIEPCRSCGAPRMDHDPVSGIPSKFCTGFKEQLSPVKTIETDFLWRPPPKIVPPPTWTGTVDELRKAIEEDRITMTPHERRALAGLPPLTDPWASVPPKSVDVHPTPKAKEGHPRFHELLAEMAATHAAKGSDYSSPGDILSNLRSSEQLGVPAWVGATVRLSDKFERLRNLTRKSQNGEDPAVADESLDDTLMDLAAYALLIRILREERGKIPVDQHSEPVKESAYQKLEAEHKLLTARMNNALELLEKRAKQIFELNERLLRPVDKRLTGCVKCGQKWPECGHD